MKNLLSTTLQIDKIISSVLFRPFVHFQIVCVCEEDEEKFTRVNLLQCIHDLRPSRAREEIGLILQISQFSYKLMSHLD